MLEMPIETLWGHKRRYWFDSRLSHSMSVMDRLCINYLAYFFTTFFHFVMFQSKNTHLLYESGDPRLDGMIGESFWFLKKDDSKHNVVICLGVLKDLEHREPQTKSEESYSFYTDFNFCSKNPNLLIPIVKMAYKTKMQEMEIENEKLLISIENMETIL